jgi:hypothetical protein
MLALQVQVWFTRVKPVHQPGLKDADPDKFFCTAAHRMLKGFMTFAHDSRV